LRSVRGPRGGLMVPVDIAATAILREVHSESHTATWSSTQSLVFESGVGTAPVHRVSIPICATQVIGRGRYSLSLGVETGPDRSLRLAFDAGSPLVIVAAPLCACAAPPPSIILRAGPNGPDVLADLTEYPSWLVTVNWPGQVRLTDG